MQQIQPVALVTSQFRERANSHTFGVCLRSFELEPELHTKLKKAMMQEFGSIAEPDGIGVALYQKKKMNTIVFVRVSASRVSSQQFVGLCRRLGNLLVKLGIAAKAELAATLPPPKPTLNIVR